MKFYFIGMWNFPRQDIKTLDDTFNVALSFIKIPPLQVPTIKDGFEEGIVVAVLAIVFAVVDVGEIVVGK